MKTLLIGLATVATLATGTLQAADAPKTGDAKRGESKNAMCIGCHGISGYRTAFPEVYRVPKIGGQHAEYIVAALKAYQEGARNHPSMKGVAASLTEQDMLDLAAYYSKQK